MKDLFPGFTGQGLVRGRGMLREERNWHYEGLRGEINTKGRRTHDLEEG